MMKKIYLLLLSVTVLVSCKNSSSHSERTLPSSSGAINSLAVVMEDSLWKGEIGGAVRAVFTEPVTGLPQEEPKFDLSHIPPVAFKGLTKRSRIFIEVKPSAKSYLKIVKDTFARPQVGVFVGGHTYSAIRNELKNNAHKIISQLKRAEIKADQRRISKALKSSKILEDRFGLNLKIPVSYRYAVKENHFVWLRKDISHGSMEILVYQVPLSAIDKDTNVVQNIIHVRDSIGKKYIPGSLEGSYMRTETAFTPYLYETEIDNKFTYLTKGNWEMKDVWMAGPFVNYAIRDEKNNRYLILDGLVFKPQTPTKRNNIFELQSIFRSAKLKDGEKIP